MASLGTKILRAAKNAVVEGIKNPMKPGAAIMGAVQGFTGKKGKMPEINPLSALMGSKPNGL
jgi:hypothetical protein